MIIIIIIIISKLCFDVTENKSLPLTTIIRCGKMLSVDDELQIKRYPPFYHIYLMRRWQNAMLCGMDEYREPNAKVQEWRMGGGYHSVQTYASWIGLAPDIPFVNDHVGPRPMTGKNVSLDEWEKERNCLQNFLAFLCKLSSQNGCQIWRNVNNAHNYDIILFYSFILLRKNYGSGHRS